MSVTRREIGQDGVGQSSDAANATTDQVVAFLCETAEASGEAAGDTDHSGRTHPVAG